MALLRLARPLWLDRATARQSPKSPALRRDLNVDIAIIGAGVTGAALAWKLASGGLRVAVLEANVAGRGSTAASTALLMREPDEDFSALEKRYGTERAARIWELSGRATKAFIGTIEDLRIRCHLTHSDSVYYTRQRRSVDLLRREYELRRAAGIGGRWLDRVSLRDVFGIDGAAAIQSGGNAQADPVALCNGLIRAAISKGAKFFERTPVRRIVANRAGVFVTTADAEVRASYAVIATGYATPEFKPLVARFRMLNTYVIVTEPLTKKIRDQLVLPADVMLWDTERPYHYARWSSDGRLMMGGGDRPRTSGAARVRAFRAGVAAVRSYFEDLYPLLKKVRISHRWEGLFATTPDGLPYIGPHRRYPRHLFALGYGGNGMTFAFLAAELIAERLGGRVTSDHDLFAFGRTRK